MASAMKKANGPTKNHGDAPRFPPEAYEYSDDVTPNAVKTMREAANKSLAEDEWEIVDGFGLAELA
ncbi:hypothetical protein ABWH89_18105 [Hoeflea alexandrii]|uniref:hypothetical protein n=1 Tax=Hoeflea alexandrii TaxID=288436 RepID=UPI0035D107C1